MMEAKPAKGPSQKATAAPERPTARSTRSASAPPAPLSMQIGNSVAASSAKSCSSNGSAILLAGFSPTPRLTAMYGAGIVAAALPETTAMYGLAPEISSVSAAHSDASSGSDLSGEEGQAGR